MYSITSSAFTIENAATAILIISAQRLSRSGQSGQAVFKKRPIKPGQNLTGFPGTTNTLTPKQQINILAAIQNNGRLAQRESTAFTRQGSLVQSQYRPPIKSGS